jgi:hypothetical protein
MQQTVDELAASALRESSCVSCHMPRLGPGPGHLSHRFLGGHDEVTLRQALTVEAQRLSASVIRLILRPQQVGHALPTGDMFRRLQVRVESLGRPDRQEFSMEKSSWHAAW